MKPSTLLVALPLLAAGCTTLSLERHTLNQVESVPDLRYQEVLDNLAKTAANPGTLPSYSVIVDGNVQIADTANIDAKTMWTRMTFKGFSAEALNLGGNHNPQQYWTLDPVANAQQLEAAQYALCWAVLGPPPAGSRAEKVLHLFQVDEDLRKLPPGWLQVGCHRQVPHKTCYRANCGDTWVWVNPDGLQGLSEFTLVLLDIATVDLTSLNTPSLAVTVKTEREHPTDTGGPGEKPAGPGGPSKKYTTEQKVPAVQTDSWLQVAIPDGPQLVMRLDPKASYPQPIAGPPPLSVPTPATPEIYIKPQQPLSSGP